MFNGNTTKFNYSKLDMSLDELIKQNKIYDDQRVNFKNERKILPNTRGIKDNFMSNDKENGRYIIDRGSLNDYRNNRNTHQMNFKSPEQNQPPLIRHFPNQNFQDRLCPNPKFQNSKIITTRPHPYRHFSELSQNGRNAYTLYNIHKYGCNSEMIVENKNKNKQLMSYNDRNMPNKEYKMILLNVHPFASKRYLKILLLSVGPIKDFSMISVGCYEVTYYTKEHLLDAINKFNNFSLNGQRLICQMDD